MNYERFKVSGEFLGINRVDSPDHIADGECQEALNLYSLNRGWLNGRLGSSPSYVAQTEFNYTATNGRLLSQYDTDKGTPAVGSPGITTNGDKFIIAFFNTQSGANKGGAIVVLHHDMGTNPTPVKVFEYGDSVTGVPNAILSSDGVTYVTRLAAETDAVVKTAQSHGKVYLPLQVNKLLSLWIENDVWHCEQLAIRLFDIDKVLIDARTSSGQENNGSINGQLVLSPYIAPKATAVKQTKVYATGIGTYDNPIVNRADGNSGEDFIDITQNPTRDPNLPLQQFPDITVPYQLRTSPITGIGWQSAADIFYRPPDQVANFDANAKDPHKSTIPESRWGYKFVWRFKNGTYTAPTSDMWVGDMEWSVLSTGNASDLHNSFAQSVYGESPLGLITLGNLHSSVGVDGTTLVVSNAIADTIPVFVTLPFFLILQEGNTRNICWLITVGAHDSGGLGFTNLTIERGQPNDSFTAAATVSTFFDQGSVANGSGTWSSFDNGSGTLTILKNLKHQLLPPSHPHYDDDCWITTKIDPQSAGESYQFDVGYPGYPATTGPGAGAVRNDTKTSWPTNYSITELISGNKLSRVLGYYLDMQGGENPFNGSSATGVRIGHPLPVQVLRQVPNLAIIEDSTQGIDQFKDSAGSAFALLTLHGKMDWEFCPPVKNSQGAGFGTLLRYLDINGAGMDYGAPNNAAFYSWRRMIECTRLLWDWQLSQTFPSSAIFGAPRIGLKVASANIPANATELLIFRTKNSLDPAFSSTDYGLAAVVPIPVSGDFYYFDQVKDEALDYNDSPDNYEGIKYGISPKYIQLLGERTYLANLTEYYVPDAPRGEVKNTDDSTPMNTTCVFEAWADTVNGFPFGNIAAGQKYVIVYRDINGFTSSSKTCNIINRGGTSAFIVKGYFLGHGDLNSRYLDVYRIDPADNTKAFLVSTLSATDGGVFYDDKNVVAGTSKTIPTFGALQTIQNPSSIRWSEPLRPEFIKATNLQDVVKGDGETITGLDILHSNIYAFKQNSTHRVLIDISSAAPGEERLETVSLTEGCIAPGTLLNNGALLFFLSNNGLRAFDGTKWHQLDEKVYNDIQAICRTADVSRFTGVFVPRYGAYWLSVNMIPVDIQVASITTATPNFTVSLDDAKKLPKGSFVFTIDDGVHPVGAGMGIVDVASGFVTATINPNITYAVATIKAMDTQAIVWVFDLFFAGGEVRPKEGVVTRFVLPNEKIFLRRRDGTIISTIIENPEALHDIGSVTCMIITEDGGESGGSYADAGIGGLTTPDIDWISKLVTNNDSIRVKRSRFTRIRAVHRDDIALAITPLTFIETVVNAGGIPSNSVPDAVVRYHKAATTDFAGYDDNVKFVSLNVQRGLDVQLEIKCGNDHFLLREIESDYNVLRKEE